MTNRIDRNNAGSTPLPRRAAGTAPVEAPAPKAAKESARLAGDSSTLKAAPEGRDVQDFDRFLQDQGQTNGCGTTSLAMMLSFWKDRPGAFTREKIDSSIRHFNLFTSPQNVGSYARDNGMRAEVVNNAKVEDLTKLLDQGVPVQILYDPNGDGSDEGLHYVVATDYTKDDKGNVTGIKIADPAGGYETTVPIEEFKTRWDKLEFLGQNTGLNNVMIPMLPKENTPIRGKDGVVRNSKDIQLPKGGNLGWRAAIADKLTDVASFAAKAVETVKDTATTVWNGAKTAAKKVWSAISSL
jgi:uncharacterized protein YvpB